MLSDILTHADAREAWVGLSGARFRLGDHGGAAHALDNALRRHVPAAGIDALADAVARAAGLPGWCGLLGAGDPVVHPVEGVATEITVDGWSVSANGTHLLGSPLDVAAIRRVIGFVEACDGGVQGWAAHPGDPGSNPMVTVLDAVGRVLKRIECTAEDVWVPGNNGLLGPRGFRVPASQLKGISGPLRAIGRDGADLLGSPLDPGLLERIAPQPVALAVAVHSTRAAEEPRRVAVVVLALGNPVSTLACLAAVLSHRDGDIQVIVVDDASRDKELTDALGRLQKAGRIEVLRHDRPLGLPASMNTGIAGCSDRDVVLLASDTMVPPGWLKRLTKAAYAAPDIGTVTPFSNHAGYLSYPVPDAPEIALDRAMTLQLDRLAQKANTADPIEIPAGAGFCLFVKRNCLVEVGTFNAGIFAQGDGAETDFCLRARLLGWRHAVLPGLFVGHGGGIDRGPAATHLALRNDAILTRLHPGYPELMRSFRVADPLAKARRRLDVARWRAAAPRGRRSVILIAHAHGGGVEQRVSNAAAGYRAAGPRPIVLRPAAMPNGQKGVTVGDGPEGGCENLRYALPDEMPDLLRFLRAARPEWVEVHHMLGHDPAMYDLVRRLRVPYDIHIHDYAWVCPRISLMSADNRYCGEPDLAGCEACIVQNGNLTGEDIGVGALRERSASFLASARRAIAPSQDTATRMRRYFPAQEIVAVPNGDDIGFAPLSRSRGIVRICVLGGIGPHKGFDVLLACARDAAERSIGLEFVVVGDTTGDAELLATGRAYITGTYAPREAVDLVRAQNATLGFVPSVWPETWSLTLTELWQAGLPVAAFDLGAPAERISATGRGLLLPLGLPPAAINDALLAGARRFGHE